MSTNFEKYIAANQSLMDCFASVPAEQYSAMSKADQASVCASEADTVSRFLSSGAVDFKNILNERIMAFDKQE